MNNVKHIIQSQNNFILFKYNERTTQINTNNNKHITIGKNDNNNYISTLFIFIAPLKCINSFSTQKHMSV